MATFCKGSSLSGDNELAVSCVKTSVSGQEEFVKRRSESEVLETERAVSKKPTRVTLVRTTELSDTKTSDSVGIEVCGSDSFSEGFDSTFSTETMDSRKLFMAPPNPPPPVPSHLKSGSHLKMMNGGTNGAQTNGCAHGDTKAKVEKFESVTHAESKMPKVIDKIESASTVSSATFASSTGTIPRPENVRTLQLNGHVGFDSLPHQLVRKCTEQGFQFNLMCVGETGMGKTTLIESLFNMKLDFPPCNNELKTVNLLSKTYDVVEGGIRLKLTIVETAGFGDQLDKDKRLISLVLLDDRM
ncbi:unnamed protein product [Toxocara canis]|uniref:Septin-type G domain-containing protein n=1 Tax=Toxocara canis TaxID=6265 RepID=A0A183TZS1_TOXCA|nr:unnamed protein product [Toxocara canis]